MIALGDYLAGQTVYVPFNTNAADGSSITRGTNGTIRIYKNGSTTQRTSSAGITDTEDFDDPITGVHLVAIDLSDNTDAGFYVAGNDYHVMLVGAAIDTLTVNCWLATFSIENRPMSKIMSEPASVFAWASATPRAILSWLGVRQSNEERFDGTTYTVRNRADSTTIATATVTDSAGTTTKGSYS